MPKFTVKRDAQAQTFEVHIDTYETDVNIWINDQLVAWLDGKAGKLLRTKLHAKTREQLAGLKFDPEGRIATN